MAGKNRYSLLFLETALKVFEERFPWLGSEEEQISGADTIDELNDLHRTLIEEHAEIARHA